MTAGGACPLATDGSTTPGSRSPGAPGPQQCRDEHCQPVASWSLLEPLAPVGMHPPPPLSVTLRYATQRHVCMASLFCGLQSTAVALAPPSDNPLCSPSLGPTEDARTPGPTPLHLWQDKQAFKASFHCVWPQLIVDLERAHALRLRTIDELNDVSCLEGTWLNQLHKELKRVSETECKPMVCAHLQCGLFAIPTSVPGELRGSMTDIQNFSGGLRLGLC